MNDLVEAVDDRQFGKTIARYGFVHFKQQRLSNGLGGVGGRRGRRCSREKTSDPVLEPAGRSRAGCGSLEGMEEKQDGAGRMG
ncbi:hypothetical protein [Streptomyces sp. NPDC101234]|uniref:hypothetical protein n=1 Tax=Streptomyces sp. NPDC101234 TaxID=3366138 RepID=UPI003822BF99